MRHPSLMTSYAALWCKSNYSFLEGASHPEELVRTGADLELGGLALTDRNGVYGAVRAYAASRVANRPLILGAEVSVSGAPLVLLAQDREGYAHLCALLTQGHAGQAKGQFRLSWDQVGAHAQGLLALWRPAPRRPEEGLDVLAEAFRGRLYALVSRHRWMDDVARERAARAVARRAGLPLVAATEVLYHHPARQELQDAVTCIRHRVRWADAGTRLKPNAGHALLAPDEFLRLYADEPAWVTRTLEVADRCRFSLAELEYRYPEEGVPDGVSTMEWLRRLVREGAVQRYGGTVPNNVEAQLAKELEVIEELRYPGYFLTMWEIVRYCRHNGILCQGRGSAANSAVCYCLGITAIDPVGMNLLFERFLSRERAEPPDIDLDIEHRRREEVIQHMYRTYGRHRAAMVANVVRYRSRSALREVGKVLDVSQVALDRYAKMISHHDEGLEGAVKDSGLDLSLPVNQRLVRLAGELQGFPRHLSIHPGGFLLGSEALDRLVPVENATMKDRTVIQWDKDDVETMNLFKVDLLGLGALTHLDYAFRLLKQHHRVDLSLATIPPDDKATFDQVCRADTVGVFQIESRAQMSMLPRLKPRKYYDLVIQVSIVRPGPISGGMVHPYLRRRKGEEAVTYPHKRLIPVLEKTLGIPLFQEQVMKLAVVAADYSPGEADQLRRDMAAWRSSGRIEEHRDRLIGRMQANGIEKEFAERVFAQIQGFGEYGFPESHAASFALIAYATAYLKCHHPDVFACALLNAWPMGFYSPGSIVADAKRHHITVRPVDLKRSNWDCTLEDDPGRRVKALRIGLRYIKGLVQAEAWRLVEFRPQAADLDLAGWKAGCRVSRETWEKLAVSGALESFGVPRRRALWSVLDDAAPAPLDDRPPDSLEFAATTAAEDISWDYDATGYSPRGHLLAEFRPLLLRQGYWAAVQVAGALVTRPVRYAGLVICRQRPGTAKGVLFLTMEDETGTVNVVVWKKVWDYYRKVILTSSFLGVEGKLQSEDGVVHLIADRFWVPEAEATPVVRVPSRDFQ